MNGQCSTAQLLECLQDTRNCGCQMVTDHKGTYHQCISCNAE